MNAELLEPALTELLQNSRKLLDELSEQRKLLVKLSEKSANGVESLVLKELFKAEIEKLKSEQRERLLHQSSKSWTIFSNDFQAQNFKVVADTVFKWTVIICGGFYLLSSLFSHWK